MTNLPDRVSELETRVDDVYRRLPSFDYPSRAMLEDQRLDAGLNRVSRETVTVPLNIFDDAGAGTSAAAAAVAAHVADSNPHTQYLQSSTAATTYGKIVQILVTGVNVNNANTDASTFTGLPSRYRVVSFRVGDPSTSLSTTSATVGLKTAASGGGDFVVNESGLTALGAATDTGALTVNTGDVLRTASTLYLRNYVAHGSAATISALLTIERWA